MNPLHRRAGKLIFPDPSLSTEQKMHAFGILYLPQQLIDNKGILCIKFLRIIRHCTWHNSPLVTSSATLTPGITSTCQGQGLTYLNLAYILYFAGVPLWNSLPQNIKSCISLPCFKRNLHKYMSENNLTSNLDGFV